MSLSRFAYSTKDVLISCQRYSCLEILGAICHSGKVELKQDPLLSDKTKFGQLHLISYAK